MHWRSQRTRSYPLDGVTFRRVDEQIESRKADHLRLTATGDIEATRGAGWDDVHLVHEALPELDNAQSTSQSSSWGVACGPHW